MAITNIAGNTFSQIYGAAKNERDSGYLSAVCATVLTGATNTYSHSFIKVPAYPGNVKLALVSATWHNGAVNSTSTNTTIYIKNFTNASDVMGSAAFAANTIFHAGVACHTPLALTLATTTSDRSAVAGMTSTEPDINAAPGDVLFVDVVTTTATCQPGMLIAWFKPVDITAAGA